MKNGQLSWGFFLITIGALFLLTKYNIIETNFSFVWDIWPMIFVLWGAMLIFKNTLIRPILSGITGIYLAIMIYGIITNIFSNFDCTKNHLYEVQQVYSEDYDSTIKYAEFNFNAGAGYFEISEPTEKLLNAENYGSWADYDFDVNKSDSISYIDIRLEKRTFNFPSGKNKNQLNIHLNENPIWDLDLNFGAAKSKFDLSYYKIRNLKLHTGASNVTMKFGNELDSTNVDIEMGAAKLQILIPKNTGCRLEGNMVLMSRDFDGLKKKNDNLYETDNFDKSKKKIFIRLNGGVSSFKIITY